ncbi:MAG: hypothetical protein INR71_10685, partial [Terriglobus roseus]|nr:hypothetical protein [Terriglobus roseus]
TFFDTVKADLDQPLFCADLKKGEPGSYDFGYIDDSKYTGDLDYTPADSSQGFWSFTADSYSIGGSDSGSSLTGIADTGTTLILTDDSVVSDYYAQVDGSKNDSQQGGYTFPCDATLPDFALIINGNAHTGKLLSRRSCHGAF